MRTLLSIKLPPISDLREGACLLLLCGTMVFGVLNIGVHRLAEKLWEAINHGLSPDGKEYVSISLAGIRVHDVETGCETRRVSWRSPWSHPPHLETLVPIGMTPQISEEAYLFEGRDQSTDFENRGMETGPTIEISPSRQFVLGKFPGGCIVWWNRREDHVQVVCFPDHILLRCFIDEVNDRYLLECLRYPEIYLQFPDDADPKPPEPPSLLGRAIDIIEYRLGTGEEIARFRDLRVGAPLDDDFRVRLVLDSQGANPRLEKWADFPRGTPETTLLKAPASVDLTKIGLMNPSYISAVGPNVIINKDDHQIMLSPLDDQNKATHFVRKLRSTEIEQWFHGGRVIGGYLSDGNYSDLLGFKLTGDANRFRFCDIESTHRLRCVTASNGDSQSVLRAADESGRVYEIPSSSSKPVTRRQMRLEAFPNTFGVSLGLLSLGFAVWFGNARFARSCFSSHGWAVILCAVSWPFALWGLAIGLDDGGVGFVCRWILVIFHGLLASLMAMLLVSRGNSLRPFCLLIVLGASLFFLCAWSDYFHCSYW